MEIGVEAFKSRFFENVDFEFIILEVGQLILGFLEVH